MNKFEERARLWRTVREDYDTSGLSMRALATKYSLTLKTIYNILRRSGDKPKWPQVIPEHKTFACRWKDEHPDGTASQCVAALLKVQKKQYLPAYVKQMWADCRGHEIGREVSRMALSQATLDELAALCGCSDADLAEKAYKAIRKQMNNYIMALFAVIHGGQNRSKHAQRFARIIGGPVPDKYDMRKDACQTVEIVFWQLCTNYKMTMGTKFFTYVNEWLPHKVRDKLRMEKRHHDRVTTFTELKIPDEDF